jgi:hypothetical protein
VRARNDGALASAGARGETPVVPPDADEPIGFEQQIKPLFRERDRDSMKSAFDLWSYDDVRANSEAILQQVKAGTMPCDGPWPADRIDLLERWSKTGMNA